MNEFKIDNDVKAIIFDCDGTLVDSMPLHLEAWKESIEHFNHKFDRDYIFSLKGMKEQEIVKLYNKKFKSNLNPDEVVSYKHEYVMKHIDNVLPVKPVVDVANKYYGILPLAVVSGSIRDIVSKELNVIGIYNLFNAILTADDPFKPKPAPDIFIEAASRLNVDPKYCVVFEDGDAGLEAAASAGMKKIDIRK